MAHEVRRGTKRVGEETIGGARFEAAIAAGSHEAIEAGREVTSIGAEEVESTSRGATKPRAQRPHHH